MHSLLLMLSVQSSRMEINVQVESPSIKRNFIYSTVFQVFRIIIPFITAPYLSRVLGAKAIGIQSFTMSIQSYFCLVAALGTGTYGAREISRNRDNIETRSKNFWEIELLTIGTTAFSLLLWLFVIWQSETYRTYYIILTIGIVSTLFDISWFFNGIEQFKYTVIRSMIIKLIGTVCIFAFIKKPEDLTLYILITSLVTLLSSLSLWIYLPRYLIKVNPREFCFKKHLKETFIFFMPTVASSVYLVLDKTLIGIITNDSVQNGYYEQAEKIISLLKSVVYQSLNAVVGVRISYLYGSRKFDEIERRIENSFNYILFMGFGCCFGIMGIAKTFVPLFFGAGYEYVVNLIYILAPIIVIVGISNCLDTQYYTPFGKQSTSVRFIIVGAVVNICLNALLIPKCGAVGASIASVLAEGIIMVLYIKHSGKYGKLSKILKIGNKKVLAASVMFIVVYKLNLVPVHLSIRVILQLICGFFTYVMLLFILRDAWIRSNAKVIYKKAKDFLKK